MKTIWGKKKERYFQTAFLLISVIFRKIRSHIINRVQILEVLPHCLFIFLSFCVSPVQHQQPWWASSTPLTCRETPVLRRAARLTVVRSLPSKPPWQVTQWLTVTGRHRGGKQSTVEQVFFWSRSQWFVVGLKVRSFVVFYMIILFHPPRLCRRKTSKVFVFARRGSRFVLCNTLCNLTICCALQCTKAAWVSRCAFRGDGGEARSSGRKDKKVGLRSRAAKLQRRWRMLVANFCLICSNRAF